MDITFAIKTFERKYCVKRLVRSLLKYFPKYPIIIGDDSKTSSKTYFDFISRITDSDISVIELPYDCGLSYGRNELVKMVKTEYFVLLDDDFVIDSQCDFDYAIRLMRSKGIDILGGFFRNYCVLNENTSFLERVKTTFLKKEYPANYIGTLSIDKGTGVLLFDVDRESFPEFEFTDIVENFFVANTRTIREKCLWDNELKINEHLPFFYEAKNKGLSIAFTNRLSIKHKPIQNRKYMENRNRRYYQVFMNKNQIRQIIWRNKRGVIENQVYDIGYYSRGRAIYLFGAGENCRAVLSVDNRIFSGVIDNDINKVGTMIKGVKIYAPNSIDWKNVFVIITVSKNEEIKVQLSEYGLRHVEDYIMLNEF